MTQVLLHYWAGARAAAGVEQESFTADDIATALELAADSRDARFAQILAGSTLLTDGRALHDDDRRRRLDTDVTVEVLPPFAGG
ncbi:MoaD/ThiS family protein [Microlunatus elymi]|uniref:MoaD/ThiS family protein n=1 Tax=Microlunatus elymi TaxID=2596828 RepID=A0A516Q4B7_9ACTN|nr:MoaD/ThiS family protein [Microlunatus elymi]QDP98225.1 MoaD/ThiS family protein [Microlunatus elymi]